MNVTISNHKRRYRSFTMTIPVKTWEDLGAPLELVLSHDNFGPILRQPLLNDTEFSKASVDKTRVQFYFTYHKIDVEPGKYSIEQNEDDSEVYLLEKL